MQESHQTPQPNDPFHTPSQESDNELWLLSYSDMMTLMFCFFVLMYAFSVQRDDRGQIMAQEIARQFNSDKHEYAAVVAAELEKEFQRIPALRDVVVEENREGVTVGFKTGLIFASGSADLREDMLGTLAKMIQEIKSKAENYPIIVEGHTDSRPLAIGPYKDNWELSAARAATVVRVFEHSGFAPQLLTAVGMGSSRPAIEDRTPAGEYLTHYLERNRRVVIRIAIPGRIFKAKQ